MIDANDPPTPHSPLLPACPICNNKDASCKSCGGRGTFRVEQHPSEFVPALAFRVASFADLYLDHGLPVVSGGALDQSNWFVEAASFCVADRERNIADRYGKT